MRNSSTAVNRCCCSQLHAGSGQAGAVVTGAPVGTGLGDAGAVLDGDAPGAGNAVPGVVAPHAVSVAQASSRASAARAGVGVMGRR
ncbi:hypothetical protein [Pseudonocardia sp. GCM10023141]|uniref:hypothetical protein n=1 Tax=Pseudonocardia sp. GCM10023141 TaxID=3252653 RepID=UPI0036D4068B